MEQAPNEVNCDFLSGAGRAFVAEFDAAMRATGCENNGAQPYVLAAFGDSEYIDPGAQTRQGRTI